MPDSMQGAVWASTRFPLLRFSQIQVIEFNKFCIPNNDDLAYSRCNLTSGLSSRLEHESGRDWQNVPQFVVRCVAPEEEIENFEWYEREAEFAQRFASSV